MMNALKLPNQGTEPILVNILRCISLQYPEATSSVESVISKGPVADSGDMNLVFAHTKAIHKK